MNSLIYAKEELRSYSRSDKVSEYNRFFKTAKGDYGEGDKFLGINVPYTRKVVKKYAFLLSMEDIKEFLYSPYHEERLFALLTLVYRYQSKKTSLPTKDELYVFYTSHILQINNWDLVDVTAPYLMGAHLLDKERKPLYTLALSSNLWERRIAIISTFAFINVYQFDDTLNIADILLHDTHDLIHKAVGWALRTVGIKDFQIEYNFLITRYKTMPRTMLRYAIEKFDEPLRQQFLKGKI